MLGPMGELPPCCLKLAGDRSFVPFEVELKIFMFGIDLYGIFQKILAYLFYVSNLYTSFHPP